MSEIDLTLALQLQAQFEEEARVSLLQQLAHQQIAEEVLRQGAQENSSSSGGKQRRDENLSEPQQEKLPVPLVDPSWEMIDPNPEVHALFLTFNQQFFWGRLAGVEVKWSPRMTLCAGVCSYEGRGGLCSVRLSVPLLKLRPRKDLIETLLHEMIHAYLFVTANNRDRDGHGPEFHKHMYRINNVAGTNISVHHSFHDEVDVYRQHVWRCNGPCRSRRPYFGLVKRAMNRAPGSRDPWWQRHQDACGGTYTKIQEPEGYGAKKQKKDAKKNSNFGDIRKFVEFKGKGNSISGPSSAPTGRHRLKEDDVLSKSMSAGRPEVIDIASDRNSRAQKSIDFGVNRKTKSNVIDIDASKSNGVMKDRDNLFTGNGMRANDKRKNNIHGFNNTATGSVKRVDVSNARKSNVHGFGGGGGSPAMKKPNRGSGGVEKSGRGLGRGGGQVMHGGDGMGHGHGHFSNTRGGFTSARGGSRQGGGLAMRGRGGSSTVTVKGKSITMTETRPDDADEVNKHPSQTLFQGQGFSLGSGGIGVSRLLTLANSSFHSSPAVSPPLESCHASLHSTVMSTSTSEPGNRGKGDNSVCSKEKSQHSRSPSPEADGGDSSKCPLCNTDIPSASLSQHLDDCMGMFDDTMSIDGENEEEAMEIQDPRSNKVESESDEWLVNGATRMSEVEASGECRVGDTSRVLGDDGREEVYPCPVCGENYSQANINQHLDKHF